MAPDTSPVLEYSYSRTRVNSLTRTSSRGRYDIGLQLQSFFFSRYLQPYHTYAAHAIKTVIILFVLGISCL
jgi:hypothetical protein